MCMLYLSWTMHILGYHQEALELLREAESIVRNQSPYRLCACLGNGCVLFAFRDESANIAQLAKELLPLAEENGFKLWEKVARFFGGLATASRDAGFRETLSKLETEIDLEDETDKSCYLGLLAKVYLQLGQLQKAEETVLKGLREANKIGEHYFTAALLNIRGEVELASGSANSAEASFREAMTFAREQGARSWELQATTNLVTLLRTQGRVEAAECELATVNSWFLAQAEMAACDAASNGVRKLPS
jgi:tetratricopeptide (TPR) repeat protein